MTMAPIEILRKTRNLLNDPARWFNQLSKYQEGQYCIITAIVHVSKEHGRTCSLLGFTDPIEAWKWNDAPERTHAEVLQRFDEAIARLEAAG